MAQEVRPSQLRPTQLRMCSAVGLAAALTMMSILDGAVGSGSLVGSPLVLLAAAIAGALIGAWTHHGVAAIAVLAVAAALTFGNQRHFGQEYAAADDLAFFLIVIGAPALLGAALVARVGQVRELAALSERLAAQRRDDIATARLEEQHRIELAVHHRLVERMGAMALLAEGAGLERDPSTRTRALQEIEETARAGLDELRHALGVLRAGPEPERRDELADPMLDRELAGPARVASQPAELPASVRQFERSPSWSDLLLVVVLGAAMAVESVSSSAARGPAWANIALAFVVATPLLVRRQRPVLTSIAVLALAAPASSALTPLPAMVTAIALLIVVAYALGAHARGWSLAAGTVLMWLGLLLLALVSPPEARDPEGLVPTLIWSGLAVGAGMVAAAWSGRAARAREVVAELEQGRDADVRVAVARQRQLIARDLHDTVAHTLSVVCLNAGAAQPSSSRRNLAPRESTDVATDILSTIADASRSGMVELRRGLHSLEPPEALSAPALQLMAHRLGIELHLGVPDEPQLSSADTTLVHRVLREALVNAGRHAPGARVDAVITRDTTQVQIVVMDGGPGSAPGAARANSATDAGWSELGAGVGLSGLAELVRERGGELEFGPVPTGGFRVAATIRSSGRGRDPAVQRISTSAMSP